jgi:ADP-heptose:LPS heptosyltransferase
LKNPQKILLDRLVGTPAAWALNLAARSVAHVARRSHDTSAASVRHIVVAKLLGMGSLVQATPLLRGLKQAYPEAQLHLLTTTPNRALVERLPCVDRGLYLDDRSPAALARDTLRSLGALAAEGIDLYFDLEVYSAASSCLSLLSLARNRFGLYRHSARFKRDLFTHLLYFNVTMPIRDIYLQLLHAATGAAGPFSTELERIAIRDEDRAGLQAVLAQAGVDLGGGYVIVNPNASDLLLERRWPVGHFRRLLELLVERGERPVLIGAPSERAYAEELWRGLSDAARARTFNSAGLFSLGQLFALIDGARCLITNDTGPMHIGFSLRRPTVCLFGPGSPEHYGIDRDDVQILYKGIFCSPCIYETDEPPCAGHNVCMQWITPEEVLDAATRLLQGAPAEPWRARRRLEIWDGAGHPLGMLTTPR